jgi:hypothetical protein
MGALTSLTAVHGPMSDLTGKKGIFTAVLPASYDAGGSVLDLSAHFTYVHGVKFVGQATAANDKYYCTYIPAAAYAPATGLVKVRDLTAAADAEASGDLSGVTVRFEVEGR